MKPEDIESLVTRMAGRDNKFGPDAVSAKRRFGLSNFGKPDTFDCDDRAELARRYAESNGYKFRTGVEPMASPELNGIKHHRYAILTDKNGVEYPILNLKQLARKRVS